MVGAATGEGLRSLPFVRTRRDRFFDGVDADSAAEELARVAVRHPAFRLIPVPGAHLDAAWAAFGGRPA